MNTALPVVKTDAFISFTLDNKPLMVDKSHPNFAAIVAAAEKSDRAALRTLTNIGATVAEKMQGAVEIRNGAVYFKGRCIDNSLTRRIVACLKEGKDVSKYVRFMANLYRNPSPDAVRELYDWLAACNLPITDEGCFVAYKRVRDDYKDCHTGTIDNSVGQVVMMPRQAVDNDRRNHCSVGLHFCSLGYIGSFTGARCMKLMINPKDVVSIPDDYNFTKGRTWRYEVIGEITQQDFDKLRAGTADIPEFQTSLLEVAKTRQELLTMILAHPKTKAAIRLGKIQRSTIEKQTIGRLQIMAGKLEVSKVTMPTKVLDNPMRAARMAAGVTPAQIAAEMGVTVSNIYKMETAENPMESTVNKYLETVAKLAALPIQRSAVAYPAPASPQYSAVGSAFAANEDDAEDPIPEENEEVDLTAFDVDPEDEDYEESEYDDYEEDEEEGEE